MDELLGFLRDTFGADALVIVFQLSIVVAFGLTVAVSVLDMTGLTLGSFRRTKRKALKLREKNNEKAVELARMRGRISGHEYIGKWTKPKESPGDASSRTPATSGEIPNDTSGN